MQTFLALVLLLVSSSAGAVLPAVATTAFGDVLENLEAMFLAMWLPLVIMVGGFLLIRFFRKSIRKSLGV